MENEQNKQTQNTSFNTTENHTNAGFPDTAKKAENSSATQNSFANLNTESVKETAKGLYDQAKSTAGQAYGVATKRATEVLEEQKETLAGGLTSVADSIKQVGENLNKTEEQNKITETAAKYTTGLAEKIENLSGYFERKDVREMVRDVEGFARKYPAYFIGGAFALGFVAARFLKSTSPKQLTQAAGQSFNSSRSCDKNSTGGEAKTTSNPS